MVYLLISLNRNRNPENQENHPEAKKHNADTGDKSSSTPLAFSWIFLDMRVCLTKLEHTLPPHTHTKIHILQQYCQIFSTFRLLSSYETASSSRWRCSVSHTPVGLGEGSSMRRKIHLRSTWGCSIFPLSGTPDKTRWSTSEIDPSPHPPFPLRRHSDREHEWGVFSLSVTLISSPLLVEDRLDVRLTCA